MFEKLNTKKNMLAVVFVCSVIYTSILVCMQNIIGVNYWDIFVYLQNAMLFSNINIGSQLALPPVLSLLVAIPFRMGFISELSLFCVSGLLFIALLVGIYLLFIRRYTPFISFMGSMFFGMLSVVVTWAVSGSCDLPALSFAIWAILFTIYALDYDFKYFYVAFICFICAFFTRYTEGFILFVILRYFVMNIDKFKKQATKKKVIKLVAFMLLCGGVIAAAYLINQGRIPFISQFIEVSKSSQVSSVNIGYDPNPLYYIQNMPQLLTSMYVSSTYDATLTCVSNMPTILSYVIMALAAVGVVSVFYPLFKDRCEFSRSDKIIIAICTLLAIVCIISYTHVSYIISEVLFLAVVILLCKKFRSKFNDMDISMFILMGVFIIMHSYHPVKVDRYIMAVFIPVVYFMIKTIVEIPKLNIKNATKIIAVLLIILTLINTSYITSLAHPNEHTTDEKDAANWLQNYDENYTQHNISSDRGVAFSWYLKKYTYTTIPRVVEANNDSFNETLNSINATYYIDSTSNLTHIEGYHEIYSSNSTQINKIKIYEKN